MQTEFTVGLNELETLSASLIQNYAHRKMWGFVGEVGSGKTTLIKSLLLHMGYNKPVDSPTFSIVNTYKTQKGIVHHFDFYRLNSYAELLQMGWEEYLNSEEQLFIEWPTQIPEALSDEILILRIEKCETKHNRKLNVLNI